jgi:hypothetical protein
MTRPLPRESPLCSNQTCRISIRVSTAKRIAAKSIRRSKSSQPTGRQAVSSTGGSKNAESGGAECAAKTAVNGGSELLIFVPPGRDGSTAFLRPVSYITWPLGQRPLTCANRVQPPSFGPPWSRSQPDVRRTMRSEVLNFSG